MKQNNEQSLIPTPSDVINFLSFRDKFYKDKKYGKSPSDEKITQLNHCKQEWLASNITNIQAGSFPESTVEIGKPCYNRLKTIQYFYRAETGVKSHGLLGVVMSIRNLLIISPLFMREVRRCNIYMLLKRCRVCLTQHYDQKL